MTLRIIGVVLIVLACIIAVSVIISLYGSGPSWYVLMSTLSVVVVGIIGWTFIRRSRNNRS